MEGPRSQAIWECEVWFAARHFRANGNPKSGLPRPTSSCDFGRVRLLIESTSPRAFWCGFGRRSNIIA